MTNFELTNNQREYFGLDLIQSHWDRVILNGDTYRPESILYFDRDTIRRHIVSTEGKYFETHYDDLTKQRIILLPKTGKGKEKKLTAATLEQRQPSGVYLTINNQDLKIGNYNTQTTFYSSDWESNTQIDKKTFLEIVTNYIDNSPENYLSQINEFKNGRRKNVKFKAGDYFCFKLNRIHYGFGRLILDVNKIRKKGLIAKQHGLSLLMGPPVIVQLIAYQSTTKDVDISTLENQPKLPSDIMMDNLLLYGEYEIIGRQEIKDDEFEFPISYGRSIDQRRIVFLQWGLIHKELPREIFTKYLVGEKENDLNPYGYYSIGFRPLYDTVDIAKTIANGGIFEFSNSDHYKAKWDLRNPINKKIKEEIFKVFGLDPTQSYVENCKITGTKRLTDLTGLI